MSKTKPGESERPGNQAETIAELAVKAHGAVETVDVDGRKFIVVPDGRTLREISDEHGLPTVKPSHIRQSVELYDKDSLVAYVKTHETETTVIFADPFHDTFTAALDWHGGTEASHNAHRATLKLQRSEEWQRWTEISGVLMPQSIFARFLEENAADVAEPSGADLLEIARDLTAHRKVNWKAGVRLQNGDQAFEYVEETEAKSGSARGEVAVPNKFVLRMPIYYGEPSVEIGAFLRYEASAGGLKLGIELHRPVFVRQAVFKQIGLDIVDRADAPVLSGTIGSGVHHSPLQVAT